MAQLQRNSAEYLRVVFADFKASLVPVNTVRDEAPELFQIETRTMDGQVAGRSTWEHVYHVRPLRRGDYQFGDLSLRWVGPLGLVIRQAKVDALKV